jgi:hypothetical protein
MNKPGIHPSAAVAEQVIDALLGQIAREYYNAGKDKRYYAHRRGLIHAICWPATWFKQRSIHLSDARYKTIIQKQLREIGRHGNRSKVQAYFPRYLLTCLQNHFLHRAESIYEQYKHVRYSIEILLQKLPDLQQSKTHEEMIDVLSEAHRITRPTRKQMSSKDCSQLKFDFKA